MPPRPGAERDDAGFTLLEVGVAFIIAALAIAALLQGGSTGLAAAQVAAQVQDATARARSRLAALGAGPLRPGEQTGTEAGFRWRTSVQPAAVSAARPGGPAAFRPALYALTAVVSWGGDGARRQVTLSTQRLGAAPPDPP